MINAGFIQELLKEEMVRRDLFLVDVIVGKGNRISVYADSLKGITLEECISLSRFIEGRLDRNTEDFELEVSSPGLDRPLKLPVQFEKNVGRILEVVKSDGIKITGKLLGIRSGMIDVEYEMKVKDSKTGKKKTEIVKQEIKTEDIKTAKIVISLKRNN